jgi:hypothetical protein
MFIARQGEARFGSGNSRFGLLNPRGESRRLASGALSRVARGRGLTFEPLSARGGRPAGDLRVTQGGARLPHVIRRGPLRPRAAAGDNRRQRERDRSEGVECPHRR